MDDFDYAYMSNVLPHYAAAMVTTLRIAGLGLVLAVAIGLVSSLFVHFRTPVLLQLIAVYVQVARNVPVLVSLFLLYFGLVSVGVRLEGEVCAILGLGFMGGGYMAESFRAGYRAIDPIQLEAARSLGLSTLQVYRYVVLPQGFAIVLPAIVANAHAILMETAICGVIAVPDLMHVTRDQIGMYYKTYECFTLLALAYLILLLPLSLLAGYLERRMRYV